MREYATTHLVVTAGSTPTTPTVTYSNTTPAPGSRVTATFSSTTGVTGYQWQYFSSGSTWTNSGRPGNTTRTLTVSNNVGTWYRISWLRGGVREYATTHLVVTAGSTPTTPTVTYSDTTPAPGSRVTATFSSTTGVTSYRWQYSSNSGGRWTNSTQPGNTTRTLTMPTSAGYWYRISWFRGSVREYATTHLVVTAGSTPTTPTVTYSNTTPAPGSRVTATFSSTTGVTGYQWQYFSSGSTWTNSGRPGNTTRTLTVSNNAGTWYRISWLRGGVREYATTHLVVTAGSTPTTPTVTYSDTTPAPGTQVTATLSSTTGVSGYQWQFQLPSQSTWTNSGLAGATTRTITFSSSGLLGYKYRLTWTRSGTREYAPNYVTVTSGTTSVTATTTDTDYVYRLATSIPLTPTGGTTTESHTPAGWTRTQPTPTSTQGVYRAQRTRTYSNGTFVSATAWGGVIQLLAPSGLAVSFDITVSAALGTVRANDNSIVYVATFSSTDAGNTIPASAMADGNLGWIGRAGFGSAGFTINLNNAFGTGSGNDLIPAVEAGVRLTLSVTGATLTVTGFTDTSEPYTLRGVTGYSAFYNALSDGAILTLRLKYPA